MEPSNQVCDHIAHGTNQDTGDFWCEKCGEFIVKSKSKNWPYEVLEFGTIPVLPSTYIPATKTVKRTFLERWFTWPWRPWVKTKTETRYSIILLNKVAVANPPACAVLYNLKEEMKMAKMICANWERCTSPCIHKDFHPPQLLCNNKPDGCPNCAEANENAVWIEPWIGVDLDGTLAEYYGWKGKDHIGPPIPAMLRRVKDWVRVGKKVKIFTARATFSDQIPPIQKWLEENGLGGLEITNVKDFAMVELWDDRCVKVQLNTGEVIV